MERKIATPYLATAILALASTADAASPKLGWAGGDALDHNASNASWYYRWWHTIPPDASGTLAEFVPLIKFPTAQNLPNNLGIVSSLPNVDTLLVLNEPERESQSDRTVAEALALWPTIQDTLPNHRLVGPGFGDDAGGRAWMDEFMTEVDLLNGNADPSDDIRLDAVAFHWYGASSPNAVSAANNFLNRVDFFHQRYNRPLWITEFAMHDWEGNDPTEAMIQANADFLEIVIPELEARSYVERYSYYNWFDDAMIFESPDRMPTVIGDQYVGTVLAGETRDLDGQSIGTDIGYLRGGELTNTGAAIPEAMRSIDALEGVNSISGTSDWSLSLRRDNYTRVRSGATLRKTGSNTIELTGALELDGNLEVAEGTLTLAGRAPVGEGSILVREGATVAIESGRDLFTVSGRDFETSGTVDGPIRFAGAATVIPSGRTSTFTSDLTVLDSAVVVGGEGFTVATPGVLPVTTQLRLNYDASADTAGDAVWEDAGGSADTVAFAGPTTPIAVSNPAFPGVTAAYSIPTSGPAQGLNQFFEGGGPLSRQDATFEIVFHVDDTAAGNDQVLMEVGGSGRGVAFVLNDSTLLFNVDGDAADIDLTATISEGWNHAIGVIDLAAGNDTVSLFVNGQAAGTLTNQTINDWAGGNLSGLGGGASSVTGVSSGVGSPFHGDLAAARFYENFAFDSTDAQQNFDALTSAPLLEPTTLVVQGDLASQGDSDLRFDIGDAGTSDSIEIAGELVVTGGTLSVSHVGTEDLAVGDAFDLFDFADATIGFDAVALPELDASLRWRLDRLAIDGAIEVVLAGDLNSDGTVDSADYTVWRDAQGSSVVPFTSGDSNGDGTVDGGDLAEWQANYGATAATNATSVPEPLCMGLGVLAVFLSIAGVRR
ncbi:MAG: glycosyl hydrolase [Planctomycetota bacterium]